MTSTQTRIVGSGFTTFNYRGKPIAFLDGFRDSGQRAIAQPEPVTPLGSPYPVEIATARVLTVGTLTLNIRELWNGPIWQQLQGLAGTTNIVDVYNAIAREPASVTAQMLIKSPDGRVRGKTYHGCVVANIDDSENVTIGALTVPRTMEVWYTHTTPINA